MAKISVQEALAPVFKQYYRLCYNTFAAAHIAVVMLAGAELLATGTYPIFSNLVPFLNLVQFSGFVFILLALRQYDLGEFSGLAALMNRHEFTCANHEQTKSNLETLNVGGLNGWVRHPLYTGVFVFLWAGVDSQLGFYTALFGSLYLWVGSWHEEKKLVRLYGDRYRNYQRDVPRFFPRPRFKL